jgi:hypothetical protein
MAHHGDDPKGFVIDDPNVLAKLAEKHAELRAQLGPELGPTGRFPQGKLCPDDKGELALRIGVIQGKVVIDFKTQLSWIGLGPDEALALAQALMQKRAEILKGE